MKIQIKMKSYIRLTIVALCSMVSASCDFFDDKPTTKSAEVTKIVELPDSVKQHIIKQDSLAQGLIAKIDTLTTELNASNEKVASLQETVDKQESPRRIWNYLSIGALILAIIALVMNILKSNGLDKFEVEKIFSDCMDKSTRITAIKRDIENLKTSSCSQSNTRFMPSGKGGNSNQESRIAYLEGKLKEVINALNSLIKTATPPTGNTENTHNPDSPKGSTFNKTGYAKINTNKFFTEILDSKQETCVYSIKFLNEKKGEFDIISLEKIKSRNGWQEVIEYHGDCTMDEAKDYTLERHGICEKIDASTWEVTTKLKIKIRK